MRDKRKKAERGVLDSLRIAEVKLGIGLEAGRTFRSRGGVFPCGYGLLLVEVRILKSESGKVDIVVVDTAWRWMHVVKGNLVGR